MHKIGKNSKIINKNCVRILDRVVIAVDLQYNNLNHKFCGKAPKKSLSVDNNICIDRWRLNADNNGELQISEAIALKPARFQQKTTTERQSGSNAWGQNDRSSNDGNIKEQVGWMNQESYPLN